MNLDGIIEDYPNTLTPLNKAVLTNLANAILGVAFPIGKTEMFYDAEDHSNYMGFTWELTLVGKMPIGINVNDNDFNQIGKSSGEKAHNLTITEMPKHKHILFTATGGTINFDAYTSKDNGSNGNTANTGWGTETSASGGSQPHNNMPPYEVVAFWKRVG